MLIFQLFQIYSGLLSRIHPICKAMGLVNTHVLLIWKVLLDFSGRHGSITARTSLLSFLAVVAGSSLEDPREGEDMTQSPSSARLKPLPS